MTELNTRASSKSCSARRRSPRTSARSFICPSRKARACRYSSYLGFSLRSLAFSPLVAASISSGVLPFISAFLALMSASVFRYASYGGRRVSTVSRISARSAKPSFSSTANCSAVCLAPKSSFSRPSTISCSRARTGPVISLTASSSSSLRACSSARSSVMRLSPF